MHDIKTKSKMIIIRKATIKDIENIIPVFLEYENMSERYLDKKYKSMRNKKKPLLSHMKKELEKDIKKENSLFLIAEEEKEIIGYAAGELRNDASILYDMPKTGELSDLAVLKKHQRKGVATKLCKELLSWFKRKKCVMVTLSVNVNNDAQQLYSKLGFDKFYLRMIKKI